MLTREEPFVFGRGHRLVGIVTEPASGDGPASAAASPTVILLNAGLIHRIGPRRIHVHLARRLAARGLRVLRMDLSGIGDSESRRDGLSAVDGIEQDVREAMDALAERKQARAFLLFGICSGAKVSFRVALNDARVAGAVLVDPGDFGQQAETSPVAGESAFVQHYVRHYWRSVLAKKLSFKRVAGWFTGKANYAYARKVITTQLKGLFGGRREAQETRAGIVAQFESLGARGVRLALLYGDQGASRVFFDMMLKDHVERRAAAGAVSVAILPETNHNFVTGHSQETLLRTVERWVAPWIPPAVAAAPAPVPAGAATSVPALPGVRQG